MREVCARTGLARSTIHHYIREGVLPRPNKTGRNAATYDEEFVRRALLVKTLQKKTHMPLASIRQALDSVPTGAASEIDLDRFAGVTTTIADSLRLASERELSRAELLGATGMRPGELDGLAAARLIEPIVREGRIVYSPLDVRIAHAIARIRAAGATTERGFVGSAQIVRAYRKHLAELARVEAREMVRLLRPLAEIDVAALVRQSTEPLGDLINALHQKALVRAVTELIGERDGNFRR
jgi:DNA-binding transcriptional MerR regulator